MTQRALYEIHLFNPHVRPGHGRTSGGHCQPAFPASQRGSAHPNVQGGHGMQTTPVTCSFGAARRPRNSPRSLCAGRAVQRTDPAGLRRAARTQRHCPQPTPQNPADPTPHTRPPSSTVHKPNYSPPPPPGQANGKRPPRMAADTRAQPAESRHGERPRCESHGATLTFLPSCCPFEGGAPSEPSDCSAGEAISRWVPVLLQRSFCLFPPPRCLLGSGPGAF